MTCDKWTAQLVIKTLANGGVRECLICATRVEFETCIHARRRGARGHSRGCTPRDGGRCTTVGEIVTDPDGSRLQCFTDTASNEHAPHWHPVP